MEIVRDQIRVADHVVAVIAGVAAQEIHNVLVGGSASFYEEWTKRLSRKPIAKGIYVDVSQEGAGITMMISVKYGTIINTTCRLLQEKVKQSVEYFTGIHVRKVDVQVAGLTIE